MKLYTIVRIQNGKKQYLLDSSYSESYEYEPGSYMVGDVDWSYSELADGSEGNILVFSSKLKETLNQFFIDGQGSSAYEQCFGIKFGVIRDFLEKKEWSWEVVTIGKSHE